MTRPSGVSVDSVMVSSGVNERGVKEWTVTRGVSDGMVRKIR